MPEVKLPDAGITFDSILYVIALIVAFSGILVALVKGYEAWKKISVRDRVKTLEGRMDKVEARLKLGDLRFSMQNDDLGHLLNTQMTLMLHFASGNDHQKLKEQITALSQYMTERTNKLAAYAAQYAEVQQGGDHND